MRKSIIILALFFPLAGCTTMTKQIESVLEAAHSVGNIEYHRSGFLTDSDLTVHVTDSGERIAHYSIKTKAPGGPSVSITVEGIKPE